MSLSPSESAESPDSPSPIPPSSPTTSASRLFTPIPSSPPLNSETSPSPSLSQGEDAPSWSTSGSSDVGGSPAAPSDTPSTGSGVKLSKAGLKAAVGTGFRQACRLLAAFAADETERVSGVWAPDPEDVEDVSRPAANLIYRRLPDEAKSGDVVDVIALGMALVAYVGKNLQWRAHVRSAQQLGEPTGVHFDPQGSGVGGE